MSQAKIIENLNARLSEILAASPAKDLEKNLRLLLNGAFSKLNLVTREEFDVQTKVLSRTRDKLVEMESRVAELEAKLRQH
jgi:BMFP domain-containing protein YqiC